MESGVDGVMLDELWEREGVILDEVSLDDGFDFEECERGPETFWDPDGSLEVSVCEGSRN